MKALEHPPYTPTRDDPLPTTAMMLVLLLLALSLWATMRMPTPASSDPLPMPGPRLELALSGVLTAQLSLSQDDFTLVRCNPAGFHLRSVSTLSPAALNLHFQGPAGGVAGRDAYYLLGTGVGPLTLNTFVADVKNSGSTFSSLSGSVTATPNLRTFRFTALMEDAQSRPLLVTGRLVCP